MGLVPILFGLVVLATVAWVVCAANGRGGEADCLSRLQRMAKRVGISPAELHDSAVGPLLPTVEALCVDCGHVDECDEWLHAHAVATAVPQFCRNAGYLWLARQPLDTRD